MTHTSIWMEDMPIEVLEFEPVNPLISKCQIKVCYVGQEANRNKSIITKEVAKDIAKSVPGTPIVGFYNEGKEDFEEHNRIIEISSGKIKIKDVTRPYGFVSMDAKVWFQWFEDDGVQHEYLMTEGYIWTGQYPESQRIIEKGNNQSMELDNDSLDAFWTKDNNGKPQFFIINEAIMSKLCILGEDVEPCFEGASITKVQFSFEDSFKEKLFAFMKEMKEILSNEGGTPVFNTYAVEIGCSLWDAIYNYVFETFGPAEDCEWSPKYSIYGVYEEDSQKFVILCDRKELKYYRLNFSLSDEGGFEPTADLIPVALDFKPVDSPFAAEEIAAYETAFAEAHKPEPEVAVEEPETQFAAKSEEPAAEEPVMEPEVAVEPEETHEEEQPITYNLEEVVEYQELLTRYSELETKVNELTEQINTLTQEAERLNASLNSVTAERDTLAQFKLQIDRENKQKLINETFYMLSDEQKKDCLDNIDTYSYDEIEAKLSVICVRNRVSFDLDKPIEKQPTVFNIDSVEDKDAGLPAWVLRVKEAEKSKNNL